jgi:feruloyl esterase
MVDATSTDLNAFKARGGKLILQHGQSDQFIPAQMSVDYYNRLLTRYGQSTVDEFVKFYLVPGAAHGFGGQFGGAYDALTVLETGLHAVLPQAPSSSQTLMSQPPVARVPFVNTRRGQSTLAAM